MLVVECILFLASASLSSVPPGTDRFALPGPASSKERRAGIFIFFSQSAVKSCQLAPFAVAPNGSSGLGIKSNLSKSLLPGFFDCPVELAASYQSGRAENTTSTKCLGHFKITLQITRATLCTVLCGFVWVGQKVLVQKEFTQNKIFAANWSSQP